MGFSRAVEFVLDEEGGFVDNPRDPGSATNYGISQRAYPDVDIRALTRDDAIAIYQRDYWDRLPVLRDGVALAVFDCAVNVGLTRAIRILQLSVGARADGICGPKTRAAVRAVPERELLVLFSAERARYYALLDDLDDYFARGWMRRTFRCYDAALEAVRV